MEILGKWLGGLLLIFSVNAFAADTQTKTITWLAYDLPPYHLFYEGEFKDSGPTDFLLNTWKNLLNDYQHQLTIVNVTRMRREFLNPIDGHCSSATYDFPEAKEGWLWSKPIWVEPPATIILKKKTWEALGKPTNISLDYLIKHTPYVLGHVKGRLYSPAIDQSIEQGLTLKKVNDIAALSSTEVLMKMLDRDRVDYLLEYPLEINWLNVSGQGISLQEDYRGIATNPPGRGNPVHIACAKGPMGEDIINRINNAIDLPLKQAIREKYQQWLFDDALKQRFLDYQNPLN